jgi:adenylate cyclase
MSSSRKWTLFARSLLVLIGFLALSALLHVPHDVEHWSADLVTSKFSRKLSTQHPDIALVYIRNKTLDPYPYLSPIDRGLLSDLVKVVDQAGAKVIGLDVILDRPTEPAKDQALRDTIHSSNAKLVLGVTEENNEVSRSQSGYFLADAGEKRPDTGFIYFGEHRSRLIVSDHVIRVMDERPEVPKGSARGPLTNTTFAEALAKAAGREFKPSSRYISWLLPPRNGAETFLTLAAEDVLGRTSAHLPISDLLRGKIVLIGGDFDDRDQHLTPLSVTRDDFFSGLFIHAQILAQLLAKRSVQELSLPVGLLIALAAGLIGFVLGRRSGHYHLWLELGSVATLVLAGILAFTLLDVIIPFNLILIVCLAAAAAGHYGWIEPHRGTTETG